MRYHYESNTERSNGSSFKLYTCNHPLYHDCTLWTIDNKGLAVVQKKFNSKLKMTWWSYVEGALASDIEAQEGFNDFLKEHAEEPDQNGLYPTFGVRRVMWALQMKPLKREIWENEI